MHIVTLTTCHNRREKTIAALKDLYAQKLPKTVTLEHVIVDDGSIDGTADTIKDQFPKVEIVFGSGFLFWAGGMRYGWDNYVKFKKFDYLFVYNDDVRLFKDSLNRLIGISQSVISKSNPIGHVIVGSCLSLNGKRTSYGGQVRSSNFNRLCITRVNPPDRDVRVVDTLNMNCALIDKIALKKTDFLATYFSHNAADFEFGLRLSKKGGSVLLAPRYFGLCDRNTERNYLSSNEKNLSSYLASRLNNKSYPFTQTLKLFFHHGGVFWPFFFTKIYLNRISLNLFFLGRWFK